MLSVSKASEVIRNEGVRGGFMVRGAGWGSRRFVVRVLKQWDVGVNR